MTREEFIRRVEGPDIKITNISIEVPKHFHQKQSPNMFYVHITYKNEYPFIVRYEFLDQTARYIHSAAVWMILFTQRGGQIASCYGSSDKITNRISETIKRNQLKNRKENPDTLEVIRQFLKEHGYKMSRVRARHYSDYLTVNPIRFSFFVSIVDGNITYRFNHHNSWPHTIPTDLTDPNCKALESLLTIIKHVSTDFDALEAKLNIKKER